MRLSPGFTHVSAGMLAVILSGCGRGLPDAVPEGYQRVGDRVAIRASGAQYSVNGHSVPIAELFDGGEYALVTLMTDCRGQLAATAGPRFGSDGTVRGDVVERAWRKLADAPNLQPAAERLCALAETSRTVSDPNDEQAVMTMLFGERQGDAWVWEFAPSAGSADQQTQRQVRVLKKGRYADGAHQYAYLITGANDPGCSANACDGGIVGAALFELVDDQWRLRAHDTVVDSVGQAGQLPPPSAIRMLTADGAAPLLAIEWRQMHFGEGFGGHRVYGFVAGHFKTVLSSDGWSDNTGSNACVDRGECSEYTTTLAVGQADGAWPELIARRRGLATVEGRSVRIDERSSYRYDGKGNYRKPGEKAND